MTLTNAPLHPDPMPGHLRLLRSVNDSTVEDLADELSQRLGVPISPALAAAFAQEHDAVHEQLELYPSDTPLIASLYLPEFMGYLTTEAARHAATLRDAACQAAATKAAEARAAHARTEQTRRAARWGLAPRVLLAFLIFSPGLAQAAPITGIPSIIDGDTLDIHGQRIRLSGVDAPESSQVCTRNGAKYGCGREAAAVLATLTRNQSTTCTPVNTDRYGRIVATCRTARTPDIGEALIRTGFAFPYVQYGGATYVKAHDAARAARAGLHAGAYQWPWAYRQNPRAPMTRGEEGLKSASRATPSPQTPAGAFASCTQARAAGAAPLRASHPKYNPKLDGDRDGVACEKG